MRIITIVLGAAVLVVAGVSYFRGGANSPFERIKPVGPVSQSVVVGGELPHYWEVPDFTLTERSGQPLSMADLKGKVWIADFFYTTCPGPCPMLSSRLSKVQDALGSEQDIRLVSVSSDPEKDTPEVLKQYAAQFHAGDKWYFLTGQKAYVYKLANEGFKMSLVENPADKEPISHSTKLVLVDRAGSVRGIYDGVGGDGIERLVGDARRLLGEAKNAEPMSRSSALTSSGPRAGTLSVPGAPGAAAAKETQPATKE